MSDPFSFLLFTSLPFSSAVLKGHRRPAHTPTDARCRFDRTPGQFRTLNIFGSLRRETPPPIYIARFTFYTHFGPLTLHLSRKTESYRVLSVLPRRSGRLGIRPNVPFVSVQSPPARTAWGIDRSAQSFAQSPPCRRRASSPRSQGTPPAKRSSVDTSDHLGQLSDLAKFYTFHLRDTPPSRVYIARFTFLYSLWPIGSKRAVPLRFLGTPPAKNSHPSNRIKSKSPISVT